MVLVRVQYSPTCPKCDKLLEELMRAGIQYGFEVLPEVVDSTFEPFYTKDDASKIYNEEWINKHGTPKQKELYKKAKQLVDMLGSQTVVPVIIIHWTHGSAERKIVVKGYQQATSEIGIRNLIKTIIALVKLEKKVYTRL